MRRSDRAQTQAQNRDRSRAEPKVRIHFPPAESLRTIGSAIAIRASRGRGVGQNLLLRDRVAIWVQGAARWGVAIYDLSLRRAVLALIGVCGACVSSHRTRIRKASQRFVSLKACNTDKTNQRLRQSRTRVPNSKEWIITQPTARLHSLSRVRWASSRSIAITASHGRREHANPVKAHRFPRTPGRWPSR